MWSISDRRFSTLLLSTLIVLSWVTLWIWTQSSAARYMDHSSFGHVLAGHDNATALVFFAVAWTLMTIAMMLPTTLPLIGLFHVMIGDRSNAVSLISLLVAGYLGIWMVFGVMAHVLIAGLQFAVHQMPLLNTQEAGFRATLLLTAGIYQFTPLKQHCLTKCRSPLSFILERRRGRNERLESFRIGLDHGIYCIGCCWSLMMLMFLAGAAHIGWMLGLGTLMAIEKNMPWGNRFSKPLGAALLAAGFFLLVTNFPTASAN